MSPAQAQRFQDVRIDYRCTSIHHRHYTQHHVDRLVETGVAVRVGQHEKIAAWIREVHWETRDGAMQLLPGTYSKRGASQDVQGMPQLSTAMGRQVAMHNDGRVE
jgi:hypothetical protein